MPLEKLRRGDFRLIAACIAIAAVSLFVGVRYYFLAFPEASIEFRVTRESSTPAAEAFLKRVGVDPTAYRHAAVFGFDDEQKTFLERESGVAESNRLLETTVRLWRWQHRWFRPLQKEEMSVDVTTKGEIVGFDHLLPEDAAGADLSSEQARSIAERFLAETMERPLDTLTFVEATNEKRPHRTDHAFTWKLTGFDVHGADYRVQVGVSGDSVAKYAEFLKLPDSWQRDYRTLRSRNEIAGDVDAMFLLLTVLAMVAVLVLRIRRGDVRWKAAAILGGLVGGLLCLSQLNNLPAALYTYDTTTSFGGFVLSRVLLALAEGLGAGAVIGLFAASAETLYRERFPQRLSLTSILRFRSLRTREFFISTLVGLTLTCFFFAYENVFYLIANALGAWSPRDVAYSDLLSTAFPWVYVLFFGFYPAISEEFMSRMFSIPLFEKIFRSTAAAIVVAAFIWGFGHAGYPNQPFWIRGLEVGLAGIVFGLVFLRWGIVAVVVCHFSVDALYTAFVLIRSPDLYDRVSGSLSAGIFLVLLLGAALAYLRKGGFETGSATNADEGVAPAAEAAPPPAAAALSAPGYRRLPASRVAWGLALAVAVALVGLAALPRFGEKVRFKTSRAEARQSAARFLEKTGFDLDGYRSAVEILDRTDATAATYLLAHGGLAAANDVYGTDVPTPLWRVRFFVPGQKKEYAVSIDPDSGAAVGFSRELLESDPGAALEKDKAVAIARAFLTSHGIDPDSGELKEQSAKDEKARRDTTLVWEFPVRGAKDAFVRHEVVVQGDTVGSWGRNVRIPEEYRREREKSTALTVALGWVKVPLFAALGVLALILLIGKIRAGAIPWRFALTGGGIAAVGVVTRAALNLDTLWFRYDTAMPAGAYLVVIGVGLFSAAVGFFLIGAVAAGLAGALYPAAVSMLRAPDRHAYGRDAVVGGGVAFGLALGIPGLTRLLSAAIPSGRLIEDASFPGDAATAVPFLAALAGAIAFGILLAGAGGILAGIASRYLRGGTARVLAAAAFVLAFLPSAARTPAEFAVGALSLIVLVAGIAVLAAFFLRDNPLAWLAAGWFGLGGAAAARLLSQPSRPLLWSGALLGVVLLATAAWLWTSSSRRPA
jgi:Type II CAAX prenyl endopeptidase Rce1-like